MTDQEIAGKAKLRHINEIGESLGISSDELEHFGKYKAKIPLSFLDSKKQKGKKLILVSAISPTPPGEGKTTMSIGLSEGMNKIGKQTTVVLREPSLGPVFGMKGGATGGGYSQVVPMEDINLHFTGDFGAIEKAHNLLSALIDNNIQNKKYSLDIDPRNISWKRVLDVNDRALRNMVIGLGGTTSGMPRETGFDITAASEIMAILCLSESYADLKHRLGNILIGFTKNKRPIYAKDLKAHGAMGALLKDALKPNLVQTLENNPAIIHGGPFANIAQGTNTVIATKMGLTLSDYVVTEAGFGCDLGAEKFLDIKCQSAKLAPDAVVLVATVRALKYHGGHPLDNIHKPDMESLRKGMCNLEKHIENIKKYNLTPVVAINKFTSDSDEELNFIKSHSKELGVEAEIADVWGQGGEGSKALAAVVADACEQPNGPIKFMYTKEDSVDSKIERVAQEIYGATHVSYSDTARKKLKTISELGLNHLSVCIAKTQYSFSDNPALIGRPQHFTINIRDIEINTGAGFVVPIAGHIMRMPGLPAIPAAERIDIDNNGNITGLF
ncbi:MAG: formate--tetrahydrofolate ligase [Bacteroidales bacterium]